MLIVASFLFLFLTGCSTLNEEEALEFAETFKRLQYDVDDYTKIEYDTEKKLTEKLKPFLTEDRYEKLFANREVYGLMYAKLYKSNIKLEKIIFEKYEENKQEGTIDFKYTMDIKFSGSINKILTKNGEMTVVKTDNGWKIRRDWNQMINKVDLVSSDEQTAMKTAKEFKEIQYNILDYTKINDLMEYQNNILKKLKPYLTEDEYKDFSANRLAGVAAYIAKKYNTNIYLEDITFEKNQEDNEKGTIGFRYTLTFKLSGAVNKTITDKGKMVLIKTAEGWKLSYDWNENNLLRGINK